MTDGNEPPRRGHGHGNLPGENGGRPPLTGAARERALANLQSPPDPLAHTKHGLTGFLTRAVAPPCRHCVAKADCDRYSDAPGATCVLAEEYQAETAARIMDLPQVKPEDAPVVLEYAKIATALSILDRYLAHASPFVGDPERYVDTQPALKTRATLSTQLLKFADALGLTPLARKRLQVGADESGSVAAWAEVLTRLEGSARKAGAVDADFTKEDNNRGN